MDTLHHHSEERASSMEDRLSECGAVGPALPCRGGRLVPKILSASPQVPRQVFFISTKASALQKKYVMSFDYLLLQSTLNHLWPHCAEADLGFRGQASQNQDGRQGYRDTTDVYTSCCTYLSRKLTLSHTFPGTVQENFPDIRCSLTRYKDKHRNPKTRRQTCKVTGWNSLSRCRPSFGR